MKKSKIIQKFNEYTEDIYNLLDNIVELLELDIEDPELSILAEKFKDDIQGILDDDSEDIIELINEI